jgi:hypothetical protein
MKKLMLIVPVLLFSLNAFSQGYRCEGYCGGIDIRFNGFYDAGYLFTEHPGYPELGYQALVKKCQNRMPKGVQARIYRNLEVTKVQTTTTQSSSTYGSGYDVYYGYYWYRFLPYQYGSSSYSRTSEEKITIKVDSLLSTESCHFDPNITVPTYEGDLPVQG